MYSVYILENPLGKLYIGQTDNVAERLERHNRSGTNYTSHKGPWRIIYTKEFLTRSEALGYEKYLKSLKSSRYIKTEIVR